MLFRSSQFPSADAGSYKLDYTFKLSGDDAGYYTLQNEGKVSIPATITKRPVVITPMTGVSKSYGASDPVYPDAYVTAIQDTYGMDVKDVPLYGFPLNKNDSGNYALSIAGLVPLTQADEAAGRKALTGASGALGREKGENVGTYGIIMMGRGASYAG